MDPEHYGANLFYASDRLPDAVRERFAVRRPAGDVDGVVPVGADALRRRVGEWLDAGFSKFLVRPVVPSDDPAAELEHIAEELLPLTT